MILDSDTHACSGCNYYVDTAKQQAFVECQQLQSQYPTTKGVTSSDEYFFRSQVVLVLRDVSAGDNDSLVPHGFVSVWVRG